VSSGRTPFTILAGAPSDSLFVEDSGKVGLGTSSPAQTLHLTTGETPSLRLEQDGTSGFTPQTWDVSASASRFFVKDVTANSVPFQINAGTGDIKMTGTFLGSFKHGIAPKNDFSGGVATITFTEACAGSTVYMLQLTANTSTGSTTYTPMSLDKSETGFKIKVDGDLTDLLDVSWMAIPSF
jgi:hypothetical protein